MKRPRLVGLLLVQVVVACTLAANDSRDLGADHPSVVQELNGSGSGCGSGQIQCTVNNDPCYGTFTYCATQTQCNNARWLAANCKCQPDDPDTEWIETAYINCKGTPP